MYMDCDNVLQLEMTLEKLSGIALAIYFWNLPDIKVKVDIYFHGRNNLSLQYDENWRKIISEVVDLVNLVNFPDKLLSQVVNYVPLIGERIYNWTVYVTQRKNYDLRYARKIYWTPHGQIDEIKIVQEFWLKETDFKSVCYLRKPLFCIAARYAQEGYIKKNMEEMKEELMKLLPAKEGRREKGWTPYHVLYAWLVFCTSKGQNLALESIDSLKTTAAEISKKLFMKCVSNGYGLHPAKYFWNMLTYPEKTNCIMEAASACQSRLYLMHKHSYNRENELEIIIFLINHMTIAQSMRFISSHFLTLFHNFLTVWPYQELCINFLNQNLDLDLETSKSLLKQVIKKLTGEKKNLEYENKNIYRVILQKLLEKNPKRLKEKYFVRVNKAEFSKRYKNMKICYLVLILNDEDLKESRNVILDNCDDILKDMVLGGNHEGVDEFMNLIFFDDEKKKKNFKGKFNFLNLFLSCGKFDLADKHLLWHQSDKTDVKSDEIFLSLVEKSRFDLAENFLTWRYETQDERQQFVRNLGECRKYLRDQIYKIYCAKNPDSTVPSVLEKLNQLLKLFLEPSAILDFKKSLVNNKHFVVKYWKNLFYHKTFTNLDQFLSFCSFSESEIQNSKTDIQDDVNYWIDNFAAGDVHFILALLDWICVGAPGKKKIIIENYMNSPKGASLCLDVMKKYSSANRKPILDFFNYWIKSTIDVSQLKMHLDIYDGFMTRGKIKSTILKLLNKRKSGLMVVHGDLPADVYEFQQEERVNASEDENDEDGSDDGSSINSGNDSTEDLGIEEYELEEEDNNNGEAEAE